MARAAKFDVDGTIVDSNDFHVEAWRLAFARFGKQVTREALHAQPGKGGDQLVPVFLSPDELKRFGADLERCRVELFVREFLPRVRAFHGVRTLFERMRGDGLPIVLASSAKAEDLRRHMHTLGVAEWVAARRRSLRTLSGVASPPARSANLLSAVISASSGGRAGRERPR